MTKFNNEFDVKKEIKRLFKNYNIWFFMPNAGMYGSSGIPDFIACYKGKLITVEAKFGNNKPTPLQETRMKEIREHGGIAVWVNEEKLEQLEALLRKITSASV